MTNQLEKRLDWNNWRLLSDSNWKSSPIENVVQSDVSMKSVNTQQTDPVNETVYSGTSQHCGRCYCVHIYRYFYVLSKVEWRRIYSFLLYAVIRYRERSLTSSIELYIRLIWAGRHFRAQGSICRSLTLPAGRKGFSFSFFFLTSQGPETKSVYGLHGKLGWRNRLQRYRFRHQLKRLANVGFYRRD